MKKILLITVLLYVAAALAAHPKIGYKPDGLIPMEYTRADSAHGFDVTHYDVTMTVDDQAQSLTGQVVATVTAEEAMTEVHYELEALDVDAVLVNGAAASYQHQDGVITIQLGQVSAGQSFTTSVSYSGIPVHSTGTYELGMFFSANGIFTVSDPNASRYWWPCYDHPWDKAETDLHITVRDDWMVAANGIRTSIEDLGNGTKTHHWDGQNPIATYLVAFVARNYQEINDQWNGIPIQHFASPSIYANAVEDLSNYPQMMQVYSDVYGMYPFEKAGNAITNFATYGAMEHQTMVTLGSNLITGNHGYETVVAHELAHHWFGDCLTPLTWKDVWLSEGFAVYSEAVWIEATQGYQAMIDYVIGNIQNYYLNWAGSSVNTIYDPASNAIFVPTTYEKAASILHMLRLMMGDDVFFSMLNTYFETYKNGNVITQDFQDVCEAESGLDLDQFFAQWIYSPGTPNMEYTWFVDDSATPAQLRMYALTTSNCDTDFYVTAPINVQYAAGEDSLQVDLTPDVPALTQLTLNGTDVQNVLLDPDSWVLSRQTILHTMEVTNAYAADGKVMVFWNELWSALDVEGYEIWRGEDPAGPFTQINTTVVTQTSFLDESVTNGTTYYYKVRAVLDGSYRSAFSEVFEATPISFPMDQGILVVDETRDGTPSDEEVDLFYDAALNTAHDDYDVATQGLPQLADLAEYHTVIWHDDDLFEHNIGSCINTLGCYLLGGGKLIVSGWKTAESIPPFFISDFMGTSSALLVSTFEFIGATSAEYSYLHLDADKLNPAFNGTLPYVATFPAADNGIFSFDGTAGSAYQDEPVAVMAQETGTVVMLGFPLYYFVQNDVTAAMHDILTDIGSVDAAPQLPARKLKIAAFPNPFNPQTTLSYSLPQAGRVELSVYNVRGQKIKALISQEQDAGEHSVVWNGDDSTGKKVASGLYFYRIHTAEAALTKKCILLK